MEYDLNEFRDFKLTLETALSKLMKKPINVVVIDQKKNSIKVEYIGIE
jgi:hypothetical protein